MHNKGSSRKIGMLGGGIGAGSTTGLLHQSFAVGILGYGLFVFGMALVTAELSSQLTSSSA
ncbi:hypothetical protein [Halorubrum sp. Ea1]|uniref:hypothetical protein n=1 Tax=Halorubrum sp. Ea1 TaxID=1480718 RepID=UPI0020CC30EE|nr:hypothetical protein [Halorubrum sp. Ea1]